MLLIWLCRQLNVKLLHQSYTLYLSKSKPKCSDSGSTFLLGIETCLEYKERVSEEPFEVPGASTAPDSNAPATARKNMQQQVSDLI